MAVFEESPALLEVVAATAGEEAVVAEADEASGKDRPEEAMREVRPREAQRVPAIPVGSVPPGNVTAFPS